MKKSQIENGNNVKNYLQNEIRTINQAFGKYLKI